MKRCGSLSEAAPGLEYAVCKPVCYTKTIECWHCVPKCVPYTVTRCVPVVVCKQFPVTACPSRKPVHGMRASRQ